MGDMKTPDFDDLLAAFDIPDIDAKEAIQSSSEDCGEDSGKDTSSPVRGSSPPGDPPSPPGDPPSPLGDPPVVSVIVKNSVRSGVFGEEEEGSEEEEEDDEEEEEADSPEGRGTTPPQMEARGEGPLLGARLTSCMPGLVCSEPQTRNGFEGPPPTLEANARLKNVDGNASLQKQASGDLWSSSSSLAAGGEGGAEGQSVSSTRHPTSFLTRLKPLLTPHTPLPTPFTSSPAPSDTQHLPPPSILHAPRPPSPPPTPPPSNGSLSCGLRRLMDSDEDSEPDLGSPLVIQESPDSPMRSPPKFPRRHRIPPDLFGSSSSPPPPLPAPPLLSSPLSSNDKPPEKVSFPPRSPPQPERPPAWLSAPVPSTEEKYPEHIIDERDSPESPPPDQTGALPPTSKKSPSPAPAPAPMLQGPQGREGPSEEEEKMETEDGQRAGAPFSPDASSSHMDPKVTNATATASGPSRPLKVRIKTVKTPTGSITRTVTRVAPKVAGGPPSKGADGSRPPAAGRKVLTRPKRSPSQQQRVKEGSPLPVSTLQDASSAMLAAANKAQSSLAAEAKARVSATAVSITRSAALPAVSSRAPPAGGTVRSLAQKPLPSSLASPSPLLPPQGGSRPASIVNSTGAVISRSQSSLVEAFNKILNSKNLLPSYKPDLSSLPPPEWGLPLPAQGFRCLECGDAFALERSLARHYDRRSLRIEVTCNHCAKRLAFFNKCSLLLHAREHKERGLVMQCSHLVMRPVSLEHMIGQQDTTPIGTLSLSPSMSSVLSPSATTLTASPVPGPAPQQQKQPVGSKRAEPVQYSSNRCPECLVQFSSSSEVAAHFQEVKAAPNTSCMECFPPMLLPNSCSAAAHQRIHQTRPPHVCPECGGVAKQAAFQEHLEHSCLHYARRIGYRCSSCLVVFGGLNSVKSHIQTAHCEVFHKCPSCPMAFKSAPSAQGHISTQHPALTAGQAKMIYKCVMCDTVFTQKPLLYVHFDSHLTKQKVHVFKCPDCTKLYAQRSSMMEHIKATHKDAVVKQEVPVAMAPSPAPASRGRVGVKAESSDGEEWRDQEEEEEEEDEEKEAARSKMSSGWRCSPCHARYSLKEDYITHMAEQHGKVLKKFPCSVCESSFSSTSSLRRHVRVKHKGIKRVFHCQLCTEGKRTFSSRLVLDRHIQLRHTGDLGQQQPGLEGSASSPDQEGSLLSSEGGAGGRARRVKTEEEEDEVTEAKRPRPPAPVPAPPESGYRCAPCGFFTDDQALFLEHIPQHRGDGGGAGGGASLQCLQCGACFASAPSLSRHRFISHRVRDALPDSHSHASTNDRPALSPGSGGNYGDGSPWGDSPGSPSSHALLSPGEEREGRVGCKVCGKRFEKTSDLNTHFRTHGMAFITARKTDKPT